MCLLTTCHPESVYSHQNPHPTEEKTKDQRVMRGEVWNPRKQVLTSAPLCMHTCVCTCMYSYLYVRVCACDCVCTHVCVSVSLCSFLCVFLCESVYVCSFSHLPPGGCVSALTIVNSPFPRHPTPSLAYTEMCVLWGLFCSHGVLTLRQKQVLLIVGCSESPDGGVGVRSCFLGFQTLPMDNLLILCFLICGMGILMTVNRFRNDRW